MCVFFFPPFHKNPLLTHLTIGNFHRDEAAEFLQSYADILKPQDSMVVGLDSCGNPDKI